MSGEALKAPWFEAFEVRRAKSLSRSWCRTQAGRCRVAAVTCVTRSGYLPRSERTAEWRPNCGVDVRATDHFLAPIVVFLTLRHLLYWRVDRAGIHQYCLGVRNWSLSWTEIVSRQLRATEVPVGAAGADRHHGKSQSAAGAEGPTGTSRKVNRLATNADRLDAMVQGFVNPGRQADVRRR